MINARANSLFFMIRADRTHAAALKALQEECGSWSLPDFSSCPEVVVPATGPWQAAQQKFTHFKANASSALLQSSAGSVGIVQTRFAEYGNALLDAAFRIIKSDLDKIVSMTVSAWEVATATKNQAKLEGVEAAEEVAEVAPPTLEASIVKAVDDILSRKYFVPGEVSSICGAEMAARHTKMQKLVLDTVKRWQGTILASIQIHRPSAAGIQELGQAADFLDETKAMIKMLGRERCDSENVEGLEGFVRMATNVSTRIQALLCDELKTFAESSTAFALTFSNEESTIDALLDKKVLGSKSVTEEEGDDLPDQVGQLALKTLSADVMVKVAAQEIPIVYICWSPKIMRLAKLINELSTVEVMKDVGSLQNILTRMLPTVLETVMACQRQRMHFEEGCPTLVGTFIERAQEAVAKTAARVFEQLGTLVVDMQKDMKLANEHRDIDDFNKMTQDWPNKFVKEAALEKMETDAAAKLFCSMKSVIDIEKVLPSVVASAMSTKAKYPSLTQKWSDSKGFSSRVTDSVDEGVCNYGGAVLGNMTAVQSMHRELEPGETRKALCSKAVKVVNKKYHSVGDPLLKSLTKLAGK